MRDGPFEDYYPNGVTVKEVVVERRINDCFSCPHLKSKWMDGSFHAYCELLQEPIGGYLWKGTRGIPDHCPLWTADNGEESPRRSRGIYAQRVEEVKAGQLKEVIYQRPAGVWTDEDSGIKRNSPRFETIEAYPPRRMAAENKGKSAIDEETGADHELLITSIDVKTQRLT